MSVSCQHPVAYLARFQTSTAEPPDEVRATANFSSSGETLIIDQFWSVFADPANAKLAARAHRRPGQSSVPTEYLEGLNWKKEIVMTDNRTRGLADAVAISELADIVEVLKLLIDKTTALLPDDDGAAEALLRLELLVESAKTSERVKQSVWNSAATR
jgi:hypothetical protein